MPEVTDPTLLQALNGGTQAQPTQGRVRSVYTAPQSAGQSLDLEKDRLSLSRDREQMERDRLRDQRDAEKLAMERQKFENDQRQLQAQGGVSATGEEKTAAYLATRVAGSLAMLGGISGGEKPSLKAEVIRGIAGETAANYATPAERQRVESAQVDLLDAALTLGTGAAYTREQLEGYRKAYFPQLGDEAPVIADKQKRLQILLQAARVKAGAAAPQIDAALAASGLFPSETVQTQKTGFTMDGNVYPWSKAEENAAIAFVRDNDDPAAFVDFVYRLTGGKQNVTPEDAAVAIKAIKAGSWGGFNSVPADENTFADQVGAALTGAVSGATAGFAPELIGLVAGEEAGQKAAENMDAIKAENPGMFLGGEVAGAIGGTMALGSAAARVGSKVAPAITTAATKAGGKAGMVREAVKDTSFGALTGAGNAEDGERLSGAAQGAGLSLAGNLAGRAVAGGAARAIAPAVDPMKSKLTEIGVRMTPGQALGPTGSMIEEKLTSIPLVGDMMRKGRERALSDFNVGVVNEALAKIGKALPNREAGTKAMAFAQKQFNRAYDEARAGMIMVVDQEMIGDLNTLAQRAANGELGDSETVKRLQKIYHSKIGRRIMNGNRAQIGKTLDGDDYKEISSGIGKLADTAKRSQNLDLYEGLMDMQAVVDNAARRASPPEAVAKLDAADEGYALFVRAEKAAGARGSDTGTFTPTQYDAAVQRGDNSVRSKAYLRGEALGQDTAEAGKRILRDNVGNSGTFDRLAAGGMVVGGGYLTPAAAVPLVGLGAAYAPGIRDLLAKSFYREATPKQNALAELIRNRSRMVSAPGAAAALTYGRE